MKNPLKQIDFSKYFSLLKNQYSELEIFSLCDDKGALFWINDQTYFGEMTQIAASHFNDASNSTDKSDHPIYQVLPNKKSLYCLQLFDLAGNECGRLMAVLNLIENEAITNIAFVEMFKSISIFVTKEREYIAELNSMAYELEQRYEELNLVYEADEQTDDLANGPEVLKQLVHNCTDYLNVAMSALILPGENLTIFNNNSKHPIHFIHSLLEQLQNKLFPWIKQNSTSLVINELDDPKRKELSLDAPYKIACCPVFLSSQEIGGIIVIINPSYASEFSNSDRNLLEVMARKASKVVMSSYDSLTGLMKRNVFEHYLDNAQQLAQNEGHKYCVLHIDLDGVKVINDAAKAQAGDHLIKEVGKLIREITRSTDKVARLTGDKYGVLLDICPLEKGCSIADNIRLAIKNMGFKWEERQFDTSACIGIAELTGDCENIQSVVTAAELAAGVAKEQGRNIVQVYQPGDTQLQRRRGELLWVSHIQNSLRNNGFELFSQVIIPLDPDSEVCHFEILLRMLADNNLDHIAPGKFIPAAERFRLMPMIDRWVIENTLRTLAESAKQLEGLNYVWAINLSGQSLNEPGFSDFVIDSLSQSNISPKSLCLEITETAAISNLNDAKKFMYDLKNIGCSFALDDFGSGLSSFAYLKSLPVDYLKIDGAFIKGIVDDPFTEAIVKSISQVSKVMNLETIAEFVENEEILSAIKVIGIDYAQGYGVGRPIPLREQLNALRTQAVKRAS